MPKNKRNYRKEYDNYQGKKKQKKNRAARNARVMGRMCITKMETQRIESPAT